MDKNKLKELKKETGTSKQKRFYLELNQKVNQGSKQQPHEIKYIENDKELPEVTDLSGKTLDNKYTILKMLGQGGMGSVYLAKHNELDKNFAIKVLNPFLASQHNIARRFVQEAQTAAKIQHYNVIAVSDYGVSSNNLAYLVMEHMEGMELADFMENNREPAFEIVKDIIVQICQGMAAAHNNKILHRDLKPSNIFLIPRSKDRYDVKIIDFGISKLLDHDGTRLTKTGNVIGTPEYMSPEQINGKQLSPASDIYSLGTILYEMITGEIPFDHDSYQHIFQDHLTKTPELPSAKKPNIPKALDHIVLKALAKKPQERFSSMEEFAQSLQALDNKGHGPKPPLPKTYQPWWRRFLLPVLLLILTALLVVISLLV